MLVLSSATPFDPRCSDGNQDVTIGKPGSTTSEPFRPGDRMAGAGRNRNGRFGEAERQSCHLRRDGAVASVDPRSQPSRRHNCNTTRHVIGGTDEPVTMAKPRQFAPPAVSGTTDWSLTGDGHRVKLMLAACAPDAPGDGIDGPLHQSSIFPYPQCFQDQAGTTPRTTRNIMGNDRGPSGNPTRYPARTCCSIAPRTSSESAIKGPVTLPGPPVNVAQ